MDLMYKQIDFVNKKIKNKELEFKLTKTVSGVTVETTKENVVDESKSIGSNIFNDRLCTFSWYWWGFYANVNQTGSAKLEHEYTLLGVKYGTACGLIALIPEGQIPAAILGAVTAISVGECVAICANGSDDNGVLVGALGAPSNPSIFHLSEN